MQELVNMGIRDRDVLRAIRAVPREEFVPSVLRGEAYRNMPLPLEKGQTISQPYVVAYMTEALKLDAKAKVLEIGTGSGYQAAVLAELAEEVYTLEIIESLGCEARDKLHLLGYQNLHVQIGDGYAGWPDQAPFDAIILTAAPPAVPETLLEQLGTGGRLIAPVGVGRQELVLICNDSGEFHRQRLIPVAFVPMTGEIQGRTVSH